jgi:predicted kinase
MNEKKVIIIRAPPGAGKTTFVEENYPDAVVCSADLYFEELGMLNGTSYAEEFKPYLVARAHQFCFGSFIHATMIMDEPCVVVDNTNIRKWEYENYETLAEQLGYTIDTITIPFKAELAEEYHARNTHGVPLAVIQRMIREFEA